MSARFGRITWPPSRWQIWRGVAGVAAVAAVAAAGVFAFSASDAAEIPKAAPLVPVLANAASPRTTASGQTKAAPMRSSRAVKQTAPSSAANQAYQLAVAQPGDSWSYYNSPTFAAAGGSYIPGLFGSATKAGWPLVLASGRDNAGSVWSHTLIDPSDSFSTAFSFEITKITDGIAFVVRARGQSDLGASGKGLGYGARPGDKGRRIQQSLAVEFDTWTNEFDPADHQHVAVTTNGDITRHAVWKDPGFSLYGNGIVNAWIDYDAKAHSLRVYVSKSSFRPADPLFTHTVDLEKTIGDGVAYVGLTGGTGITTVADPVEAVMAWSLRVR